MPISKEEFEQKYGSLEAEGLRPPRQPVREPEWAAIYCVACGRELDDDDICMDACPYCGFDGED